MNLNSKNIFFPKVIFTVAYLFFMVLVVQSCNKNEAEEILNIKEFTGETSQGVITKLGQPDTSFNRSILGKQYFVMKFGIHQIEMRFYNDTLESITIRNPEPIPFQAKSIQYLGLKYQEPTSYNLMANYMWKNYDSIKIINFYLIGTKTGNDKQFEIYVKYQ